MQLQNPDGTQIFPAYDANKWVTAKKHLETFLEYVHSMGYALYRDKDDNVHKSIYELYQYYTDEIIWATPYNHYYSIASNMEPRTNPRDLDGTSAWGNVGVFQESVDAFFTANGLEIEEDPEYSETEFASLKNITNEDLHTDPDINSMYHNREPRFYASVVYQGRSWHVQPQNKPNYTVGFAKGQGCDRSKMRTLGLDIYYTNLKTDPCSILQEPQVEETSSCKTMVTSEYLNAFSRLLLILC